MLTGRALRWIFHVPSARIGQSRTAPSVVLALASRHRAGGMGRIPVSARAACI